VRGDKVERRGMGVGRERWRGGISGINLQQFVYRENLKNFKI
jgi:hypothetical protein